MQLNKTQVPPTSMLYLHITTEKQTYEEECNTDICAEPHQYASVPINQAGLVLT